VNIHLIIRSVPFLKDFIRKYPRLRIFFFSSWLAHLVNLVCVYMSSAIWNDKVPARQGTTTFKHIEFPLLMHSNLVSSLSFTALNAQ
jgi:hypothetical protein